MEKVTYKGSQKKIECFLLITYSIYTIGIIVSAARPSLENWVDFTLISALASSWMLFICKFKDYKFRATYTTIMLQISMILYTFHEKELRMALPVYIVFIVMVGLYGIAENILLTIITTIIIFGYHVWGSKTIPLENTREYIGLLQRLANVFFVEFLVYVWTKRNYEGSKNLIGVIEELEKAENSKDDFVANVSHEIRTPINTICGMSELVLNEEIPMSAKEKILDIQSAGRNLMGVVSDILDFSQLQSGNMELEEENYNISSTINDVISMAMAYKNDKNIELIVDCDPNIPSSLLGDEKKLRRVILKLLNNAIKFTEYGCVTLTIGYRKESYGINLAVTIKDTGIGIREESLEKLFTTFNQVDASRKRQEGGLGLGLAISQALVQKMGGSITVKSKWGKGTTVRVVVPQRVLDETPIASLRNKTQINVATYIDMEQFGIVEIRDDYSGMILHMAEKLKGKCQVCRSFGELQRRNEKEHFSHVFISNIEYLANSLYFDKLAEETNVVVVLERKLEKEITNPEILKIYKPFYILTIVSVLNGERKERKVLERHTTKKMETKDAHVLVVDDNLMNIRVVEEMLSAYKIKVTKATSGEEALEKIVAKKFDFVFMDYMMPEMDGVETLHEIRQKSGSYYQSVPVVALTANTVAGTREQLLREGFNDFMEKPIERSVLERVLKRNLPQEKIIETALKETDFLGKKESDLKEKNEKQENPNEWLGVLESKGVDVKKGIRYCNGKDAYFKILQGYCQESHTMGRQLNELFVQEDWKNYTIVVHGLKSAMYSIGLEHVGDKAKKLEAAGKRGDEKYIKEYHSEFLEEFQQFFGSLHASGIMDKLRKTNSFEETKREEKKEIPEVLREIPEEDFLSILETLESVMFNLDGDKMLALMERLKPYRYKGKSLEEVVSKAQRKIEMSDYISAVEMLIKWKEQILDSEGSKCGRL